MKDEILWNRIDDVFCEKSGLFHNLVAAAGLNPKSDFRGCVLDWIDFTGADLRGFDFSSSDLRGTNLQLCSKIDGTTIIDGKTLIDPEAIPFCKHVIRTEKQHIVDELEQALFKKEAFLINKEKELLEKELASARASTAVERFAAGIAHDFNNMLTAIIGYSDLLLSSHRPTDPAFRDIRQIKETANRAAGLTRQLLAFSRRQTLRPQVLQLGDALSEVQNLLRRVVGEKNELELRLGRDLWFVKADLTQFEQVVINLVVNARDAMPEPGGRVQICTRNVAQAECASFNEPQLPPADYVLVEVEDNGAGILPDVKEKIFEPFFTTKEVGKGTGLGLSTVFGIVKQSGGFIFVDSEVGRGTAFRIFLPRHKSDEKEALQKADAPKVGADYMGQGVILLVEDEDAVRSIGARALSARGFTVLEATTGLEALEVVDRVDGKIDLIVSDVVMPKMDGLAMFAELRKRGVAAKVIFVSGYAEEVFAKKLPIGHFDFLPKPFSAKQLIDAVAHAIGSGVDPVI